MFFSYDSQLLKYNYGFIIMVLFHFLARDFFFSKLMSQSHASYEGANDAW